MNTTCRWLLAVLLTLLTTSVHAAQDEIFAGPKVIPGQEWVADEILVKFKDGINIQEIEATNRHFKAVRKAQGKHDRFLRLRIPEGAGVAELVSAYRQRPEVEYAEPNFVAWAHVVPNDPYYSLQWNLDNPAYGGIHMEQAWQITTGAPNVIVAVVDTGVAYEDYSEQVVNRRRVSTVSYAKAPDLSGTTFVAGYDFINNDAHPNDDEGHGTHVTGTIAQSTNNATGVAGIAPATAIMPVKVLDSNGSGSYAAIADGIYFAADNGARVINMSLGGSSASQTLENALAYAFGRGVTIVCSSGNNGSPSTIGYPAAYDDYCIAVGATRYDESVSSYSNGGASLDIVAPGGDLAVDQNGDGYGDGILQQTFSSSPTSFGYWFYQGTSMAAPHVSGVAALLLASGVATSPQQVRNTLQATAEDKGAPGWDPVYGWGLLDAAAALGYLPAPNAPPVALAGGPYAAMAGTAVAFDGAASYDPDGGSLTYSWDFGDGAQGSGATPLHVYATAGQYTATLTVTDDEGGTGSSQAVVSVTQPAAQTMHVGAIVLALEATNRGKNTATSASAQVTILGVDSQPVPGASVSVAWGGVASGGATAVTGTDGRAQFASAQFKNLPSGATFVLTVDQVSLAGWSYDPAANVATSETISVP